MPSKAVLAFGAVVLVPFPFTNAVVVSSGRYARERADVILMAVTSQLRPSPAFGEVWVTDWRKAGLLKASAIKPVIATLQRLVRRELGSLEEVDLNAPAAAIAEILTK